jgi:hypothetical protein
VPAAPDNDLSAELVLRAGGWPARYARVLLIERDGDNGLVLVDGNGDGAELEVEYWHHEANAGWRGGSSSGHGPLESVTSAESWDAGDFACALGRASPAAVITIRYCGAAYTRRANEFGLWGFIHDSDSRRPGELPAVTIGPPDARRNPGD